MCVLVGRIASGAKRSAIVHCLRAEQEVALSVHKFKVGQTVDFSPGRGTMSSGSRLYKIVKLLPSEGGQLLYRIKGSSEPFERVAREMDLSLP
jgi:hypothetical protein